VALLAAVLTLLVYHPVLGAYFILDDFVWLESASKGLTSPSTLFNRGISNFFRPAAHLHFAVIHALAGLSPMAYRVSTVILHALCAGLLSWLLFRLNGRWMVALAGAALFLLLPSYTEVLVWISAVTEPLYVALCLGALIAWRAALVEERWLGAYMLTFVLFLLALAAKEAAVSLLPLMVLMHLGFRLARRPLKARLVLYLPFVLLLGAYLHFQLETQQVNYLVRSGMYALGPHFLPLGLGCLTDQLGQAWPALVVVAAGLLFTLVRRRPPPRSMLRMLAMACLLALAYLAVIAPYAMFTGDVLASRYFYFPGLVLAAGLALCWGVWLDSKAPGYLRAGVVALALVTMAVRAVPVGLSEVRRYERAAHANQLFVRALGRIPESDKSLLLVDGNLVDQQLQAAMRLFHAERQLRIQAVDRRQLPRRWVRGEVLAWDPVSERIREVEPVE